jgi:hypothetical protein
MAVPSRLRVNRAAGEPGSRGLGAAAIVFAGLATRIQSSVSARLRGSVRTPCQPPPGARVGARRSSAKRLQRLGDPLTMATGLTAREAALRRTEQLAGVNGWLDVTSRVDRRRPK